MTNHSRTLMICFGGIMAGGLTASLVEWSPIPKVAVVAMVATIVALVIGFFTRGVIPRTP